jgi:hypothetical protein
MVSVALNQGFIFYQPQEELVKFGLQVIEQSRKKLRIPL